MTTTVCHLPSTVRCADLLISRTGSGQSKFKGDEQNVKSMAADVEALMRELKLESSRTVLVGHSMGGMVACDVASRLDLLGIVLLGPVHPSPAMGPVFTQRIDNVMKSRCHPLRY